MNKNLSLNFEKYALLIGVVVILFFLTPYFLFGENSYILILDNLDSAISRIKIIFDNDALFDEDKVLPVMYGMPRSSFPSAYNVHMLFFMLFPCFWAYVFNTVAIKITAYIGLFLLLDNYLLEGRNKKIVALLVSLAFAFIPFYTDYGLSSAGIPLLVYAFLNLKNNKKIVQSYILIIYFALYSSLVLSGLFVCFYLFAYLVYLLIIKAKQIMHYVIGFAVLCIIYLVLNWDLFFSFFISSDYVSHRTEFTHETSFVSVVLASLKVITQSQYHAGSFWALPIVVLFPLSLLLKRGEQSFIILITWLTIIVGIFVGKSLPVLFPNIAIFHEFQFDRFYFLYPAVCYIMLAIAVDAICQKRWMGWKVLSYCIISILAFLTIKDDKEIRSFCDRAVFHKTIQEPTYRQFFDEGLFDQIAQDLNIKNKSEIKVVALGFHPAILEYNGYHALDAYKANYRLEYKHQFRKVIAGELEKSEDLKKYFDTWGSRCYVFSSELGRNFLCSKMDDIHVNQLDINVDELKYLGCNYIFSAVTIDNYESLGLLYKGSYTTNSSYWNINVYQLD